jgi:hypothetical protein
MVSIHVRRQLLIYARQPLVQQDGPGFLEIVCIALCIATQGNGVET